MFTPASNRFFSHRFFEPAAVALIFAAYFALGLTSLARMSVTVDEFAHLPAGLSYLRTGDFRMYPHGSPLVRALEALPLAFGPAKLPLQEGWRRAQQWTFGYEFMLANFSSYHSLFIPARAVNLFFGALLAWLVWRWSRRYGVGAGVVGLAVCAFDPNLLAHAGLATADVGGALAGFGAIYMLAAFCRRPGPGRGIGAGVVLGLALLSKLTNLILLPLVPLLAGWFPGGPLLGRERLRLAGWSLALLPVAWLTLCCGYGWQGFGIPLGELTWVSQSWQAIAAALPHGRIPLPAPFLAGLDQLSYNREIGYEAYLLGRTTRELLPHYFLVALAVKTPLATLLLAAVGAWSWRRGPAAGREEWFPPALSLAVLAAASLSGGLYLGIRYIFLALPGVWVLAARAAAVGSGGGWRRWVPALAMGTVAAHFGVYPDYLAYFNRAAGGPAGGYRVLADSNLDWGQSLIELKDYLDRTGLGDEEICLAYFGRVEPRVYGIRSRFPLEPESCATTVVSVNFLAGLSYRFFDGRELRWTESWWFERYRGRPPAAVIGHTLWVFRGPAGEFQGTSGAGALPNPADSTTIDRPASDRIENGE